MPMRFDFCLKLYKTILLTETRKINFTYMLNMLK